MSDEFTVSVVTITYKDVAGLQLTMRSVLDQVFDGHIEHIIVDGAMDPAVKLHVSQAEPDAILISEKDSGRYDAMNKGLDAATGDFVWFMHSGDTFGSQSAVSVAVRALVESHAEWGHGFARLVLPSGEFLGIFGSFPFSLSKFALGGYQIPHQAAIFRRSILRRMPPYDVDFGLSADQLFMLRAAILSAPIVIADFLADFDATGAGTTRPLADSFRESRIGARVAGYTPSRGWIAFELMSRANEFRYRLRRRVARRRNGGFI